MHSVRRHTLAYIAYGETRFVNCIGYCLQALDAPIPPTQLWRERNKYTDQPARMISWCYEHLGYLETALHWAVTAREKIGDPDASWEERIARLEKPRIALSRPGAIGDILMTLNLIPHFRAKYPGHSIHYFCDAGIGAMLKGIMKAAGVDIAENSVDFNFRQNEFSKCFNLIGYPFHEGYPEKPMRQHLINYFAEELGLGEIDPLVIPVPTRLAGLPERYATLQPRALWSAYKNWPFDRWERVLEACSDIPVYQIGARGEPPIPGARHDFLGTTMSNAISLVANARLHLGVDSFANHLTFFRWGGRQVPAVILWGSTQPTAAGYAHNSNLSLALWCQPCFREDPKRTRVPRGPCVNPAGQHYENPCHACMAGLHVDLVVEELRRLWAKVTNTTVVSGAKSREAC